MSMQEQSKAAEQKKLERGWEKKQRVHMVTMRYTEIELFKRYSIESFVEQLNAAYSLCVFTFQASFYFLRQTEEKCALYINST